MLNIYTDGACSNNQSSENVGGWSYAVFENDKVIFEDSGRQENTTNNVMELTAILEVLKNFNENMSISTDSELCQKWISGEYKVKVKNEKDQHRADIINDIKNRILVRKKNGIETKIIKVKGHGNDEKNIYVDKLAVKKTKSY